MKKRLLILSGVAVLVLGLVVAWVTTRRAPAPTFQSAAVERGDVVAKVTATGTLSPLVSVQVGSQVSGRIQEILVDFNSPVKKGQVLAKLDPQLIMATLERERANYTAAKSQVTKSEVLAGTAKRQLDRTRYLADRQLIATAELETAQANYDTARAQVIAERASLKQAGASLHQAEVNLGYTTIVSPVDGVVISRNIDVGQTVAASLQAPTLFLIAQDLRQVQVNTNVAEADIGKLKAGLAAEFTVDAFPGETFRGKVRQIRNAPQTVQNVVTYDAVLDVANPEQKLKPGMTANVTFLYDSREDVLRLPNAALRFQMPRPEGSRREGMANRRQGGQERAEGGEKAEGAEQAASAEGQGRMRRKLADDEKRIWVLREGRPRPVVIKPGLSDGSFTEVREGELEEGDQVITGATGTGTATRQRRQQGGQGGGRAMRMF